MITVRRDRPAWAAHSVVHCEKVKFAGYVWDVQTNDEHDYSILTRDGVEVLRVKWGGFATEQFSPLVEVVMRMHLRDGPRFTVEEYK